MNDYSVSIKKIENKLAELLPVSTGELACVPPMLAYSLEGGGKRVRPLLCLKFCECVGGKEDEALYFACAVEFIHTYSLIHDDLPCMDNDCMRRGKPSSHIKFGEANALLAGDALLTHAFGILSRACREGGVDAGKCIRAVGELSELAGVNGMIGGQYIDLKYENKKADADILFTMDALKTSKLIEAGCVLGVIAGGGSEEDICRARAFALNLGIAFQIKDDLLETDDADNSDEINNKSTYITLFGKERAAELAEEYTSRAIGELDGFGERSAELKNIAFALLGRTK